jgi:hypothetical protein
MIKFKCNTFITQEQGTLDNYYTTQQIIFVQQIEFLDL